MNDYMRAMHQRFYRKPDFSELEEDIENTRQEVRDCLDKRQRRRPGTGCVSHLREHLWKGGYSPVWPDGKSTPGMSMPRPVRSVRRS